MFLSSTNIARSSKSGGSKPAKKPALRASKQDAVSIIEQQHYIRTNTLQIVDRLTVSNLEQSLKFYQPILTFLGYQNTENHLGLAIWESGTTGSAVNLWQAKTELAAYVHKRYAPGLHHLAFNADTKAQVDEFYQLLLEIGATILEPPTEYDSAPGYYAVFFTYPDGIKLELAHIPGLNLLGNE